MSHSARALSRLSRAITPALLRRHGVLVGTDVRCLGMPIVTRHPDSTISVGDRAVLVSRPEQTALGVSRPVILRTLAPGARLSIGADTGMSGTVICAAVSVDVGEGCLLGADVMIFDTDFHPLASTRRRYASPEWPSISAPVRLGSNVFVGARVIVCKGVTIGDNSVIGAGSVVVNDIPSGCIAGGNPCRFIKPLPLTDNHHAR